MCLRQKTYITFWTTSLRKGETVNVKSQLMRSRHSSNGLCFTGWTSAGHSREAGQLVSHSGRGLSPRISVSLPSINLQPLLTSVRTVDSWAPLVLWRSSVKEVMTLP